MWPESLSPASTDAPLSPAEIVVIVSLGQKLFAVNKYCSLKFRVKRDPGRPNGIRAPLDIVMRLSNRLELLEVDGV